MVEPIAGLVGIFAVSFIKPLLPYALAFAAGAMIYVVVNDIIPESNSRYLKLLSVHGRQTTSSLQRRDNCANNTLVRAFLHPLPLTVDDTPARLTCVVTYCDTR